VIEVNGVTKHYREKLAVNDLSFEVKPGQVTGFLGPNGSGKSTTMRMIMGLDAPDAGVALVNAEPTGIFRFPSRGRSSAGSESYPPGAKCVQPPVVPGPVQRHTALEDRQRPRDGWSSEVARKRAGKSRWAWDRGWASPRPCSAIRRSSSSMNRSMAWIPRILWVRNLLKRLASEAARCSCRVT